MEDEVSQVFCSFSKSTKQIICWHLLALRWFDVKRRGMQLVRRNMLEAALYW
jgi:hypothetical protein